MVEYEIEPENWRNPTKRVKAQKVPTEPLEPVSLEQVHEMIEDCEKGTFNGDRGRAISLTLIDTGVRAAEFLNVQLQDLNIITGNILIREGKGRKPRNVLLGEKTRKAVRTYLKYRNDDDPCLWVTQSRNQLTYGGLRQIICRRTEKANIPTPGIHDFRRAFALESLRNGVDLISLSRLMGDVDTQILRRYLAQSRHDLQVAHQKSNPVDHAEW